ncbi:MAG TPA: DUF4442 domain-containing protein [Chitinophagaceae bacterium]|jgi:hypothetical protein|nr:DUF4442 domain-containing protein [Chitinophagaceae bacterium]
MNPNTSTFIKLVKHPVKFRMFLFFKLPAAYISGVRVREIDENHCVTTVPYKWLSQNPFRSTYFACLSMAAELSTGALAMAHLYKSNPVISMLVVKVESEYFKKAIGKTKFLCEDGNLFQKAVTDTIATGEAVTVNAKSVGTDSEGATVAVFTITWSLKVKSQN